jgi:hypothetical protein
MWSTPKWVTEYLRWRTRNALENLTLDELRVASEGGPL